MLEVFEFGAKGLAHVINFFFSFTFIEFGGRSISLGILFISACVLGLIISFFIGQKGE